MDQESRKPFRVHQFFDHAEFHPVPGRLARSVKRLHETGKMLLEQFAGLWLAVESVVEPCPEFRPLLSLDGCESFGLFLPATDCLAFGSGTDEMLPERFEAHLLQFTKV